MNQFIIYSVKHCGLEGYSVARKFLPLIVGVLFLIPGLSAQSTWVSQVERSDNQIGQNLIERTSTPNSAVMCSKIMQWIGEHTSLLTDSTSTFVVKDMYIFNKGCYFCGYISVQTGEPLYNNQGEVISTGWYSQGVVGFFDLRDLNLPNAKLQLLRVAEVDSLMHLVVHQDDPFRGPLIMAVGRISINLPSSCVVELQCPLPLSDPNTWTKRVVQPLCFDDDEYPTDIILTDSFLEVVSKLPYWGEEEEPNHYIFRLHQTKREGFYATSANMGIPVTAAQYSIQDSEPTIFDCEWATYKNSFIQSQIIEIPVEYFPSFSDCLIDEDQWQRR